MKRISFALGALLSIVSVSSLGAAQEEPSVQVENPEAEGPEGTPDSEVEPSAEEEPSAEPGAEPGTPAEPQPLEELDPSAQSGVAQQTPAAQEVAELPPPPGERPLPCGATAHQRAADSVVRIRSGSNWGAGFVYRDANTIVTAFSLLAVGRPVRVVARDGTAVDAQLLANDPQRDLALLHVEDPIPGATPLEPAPESSVVLGTEVVALGHPFPAAVGQLGDDGPGLLRWSLAAGHVAAVNPSRVQVDLAVTVGHAGAPVLDCAGRVLGHLAGSTLLSPDLGLVSRISRADELLDEEPEAGDFFGDFRFRLGLGFGLHLDEQGRSAPGLYIIAGAVLFDRVSWMNRVGFFFGGNDAPAGAELSVGRQTVHVNSLLGWRFFLDLFGLTTLHIVPAGGVSVIHQRDSARIGAVTPMCTPTDTDPCFSFSKTSQNQWIVRPSIGLTFIVGGNIEIGYTLDLGLDTRPVETYHMVRLGLSF